MLVVSAPRNGTREGSETAPSREARTCGVSTVAEKATSNVTPFSKSAANRGIGAAAGVIPGACQVGQVIQKPYPRESALSRTGRESGGAGSEGFHAGGQWPNRARQGSRGPS